MRIDRVELREVSMRLRFPFETSFGVEQDRRVFLVTVFSGGLEGYAECVAGEAPGYAYETNDTAWSVLRDFAIPKVLGRSYQTPAQLLHDLRLIRGHNMAIATLEMAFWDLQAKAFGVPLWTLLGGRNLQIPVGISIGIQKDVETTNELIRGHLAEGYRRVKLKIKPGWDVELIEGVREEFPDIDLTVDANSAYRLTDARVMQDLDEFNLGYIEQPLAYDDLHDHAKLQAMLATPICLDESIHSPDDVRKALETDAGRVINVKVGRVRGHREARRVHDIAQSFGTPVWCGGMLESGVGRAHNLHLSTLENFLLPGDTSSASRYWDEDIVTPLLDAVNGIQSVPEGPGIGVELKRDLIERNTVKLETF
jgi:O-succinylbenzoate synthase